MTIIETIAALTSKEITLKAVKESHPELKGCKTIEQAVNYLQTLVDDGVTETVLVSRLEEIVVEVCQSLDNIQSESIKVGALLNEANAEFKAQEKKSAEFVEWCFDNFSIKKAQAYKLMKVAEVFGDDKQWHGVSMRVLYALATQANDEELNKARELAANNSLTSGMLNVILKPKAEDKQPEAPEIETNKEAGENSLANVPTSDNVNTDTAGEDDAPFDMGDKPPVNNGVAANLVHKLDADNINASKIIEVEEENANLRKQLSELLAQIKQMNDEKVQHNSNRQAMELPQFNSACHYAVLGLSAEEATSKAKVKAAFRGLVAAGYGSGHTSFEKIVAAKDALLA